MQATGRARERGASSKQSKRKGCKQQAEQEIGVQASGRAKKGVLAAGRARKRGASSRQSKRKGCIYTLYIRQNMRKMCMVQGGQDICRL